MAGKRQVAVALTVGALIAGFVPSASAATFSVDDDHADCPAAQFSSVQAAVNAAAPGDTVAVCPGSYTEGPGGQGTNALTIAKPLTLKGAGADLVTIRPSAANGGRIAEAAMNLRNGVGDILAVAGGPGAPIDVQVSGIAFDGAGVYVEAGVVFLDAKGSVIRSRVTNIVTSEAADAESQPGGYRSDFPGVGIAQVTAATNSTDTTPRVLTVDHTRVDEYNRIGVLIDGATGDSLPLTASGVVNQGVLTANQIIGRTLCLNYTADGNCSAPALVTTGTTFGQDGVRITAGAGATFSADTISQNLVHGALAPPRGAAGNNQNLSMGAGVRFIGAAASTIVKSNIVDNAYGVYNVQLDGSTANAGTPVSAETNWWGLRPNAPSNSGPAISPATNPAAPENPVNGTATGPADATTSTAVDFFPFRNGSQSDPNSGEWPVVDAPIPVNDAGPTASLSSDKASAPRGSTVTLTAEAVDDFGVKTVSFYEGAALLGTVSTPPYTRTVAVAADAPLVTRSFSAVAEDSSGQTASGQTSVQVTDPPPPPGNGGGDTGGGGPAAEAGSGDGGTATGEVPGPINSDPPADPAPTVSLAAPARIAAAGTRVAATPDAAAGVARVDFFLGNRLVCSRTAAPFVCTVLPTGADVGRQTLRVLLTDLAGASALAAREVVVGRFLPAGLDLRIERVKKSPRLRTVTGKLRLSERVTRSQGCRSGAVTLVVKSAGEKLLDDQVPLRRGCAYRKRIRLPRGARNLVASARFGGNTVLTALSAKPRLFR